MVKTNLAIGGEAILFVHKAALLSGPRLTCCPVRPGILWDETIQLDEHR